MKILRTTALVATFASALSAPAFANAVSIQANGQTFAFKPNVVMLKKGQSTTLNFKATPGAPHGLNVPELGIKNLIITPGGASVAVKPMKAGTYEAHCTIVCGAGHAHMAMKFIVK